MRHAPCFRTFLAAGCAAGAVLALQACVPIVVGGAAAGGYVAAAQERSIGEQIDDKTVKSEISESWANDNDQLGPGLDITVYQGRVLLTGRLPNPAWRDDAVRLAWKVQGVNEVYDEIQIGPIPSTGEDLSDAKITAQLRADLMTDRDIHSLNYTITTADHVVFLIGAARNQAEIDAATNYARNEPNVRRVVSYVKIREGAPPENSPTETPANQNSAPPDTGPTDSTPAENGPPDSGSPQEPTAPPQAQGGSGGSIDVKPLP